MTGTDRDDEFDEPLELTDVQSKPRKKSFLARFIGAVTVLVSLLFLGIVAATAAVLWVFWTYGKDLPDYHQLAKYEPPVATRIHAGNGALIAEHATEKRVFMPVEAMPPRLIQAFLSAEDKAFYSHFGVDPRALFRAVVTNAMNYGTGRRPIGASTITQQVTKNFLLTNEVSIDRKIKEAILSFRMERAFTKDQILALYLNEIYLGMGSYGVAAAALNYFDKSLDQLTLEEMAYLAALPKAPANYHPIRKTRAATIRRDWVLGEMQQNGFITGDEARRARAMPLQIARQSGFDSAEAPYFAEEVRREVVSRFGEDMLYAGGLSVRTTLDPELQHAARMALQRGLEALDRRQGWRGALASHTGDGDLDDILAKHEATMLEDHHAAYVTEVTKDQAQIYVNGGRGRIPFQLAFWAYPPRGEDGVRPQPLNDLRDALAIGDIIMVQPPEGTPDLIRDGFEPQPGDYALSQRPSVEGAIVALDPHTGRLLAMSGGYNYLDSEFNRAVQALRQPGSAFKPFVYLAALDQGYNPTTRILDAPLVVDQGPGKPKWKPANYTRRFYGPSIMRVGIEKSRNLMTARLAMNLGMDEIGDYARRFGLNENLPPLLSMSLGAGETTLLRLTAAYGMLVNGGKKITPSLIDRVQDRNGKTIYRHDGRSCDACQSGAGMGEEIPDLGDTREQLTSPASAFQMVSMLEGVIKRGTGRRISKLNLTLAGKTGTTNDNTNGWFIGFTPDLAVGVFVGYDTPRQLGKRETGSTVAVPIFGDFIAAAQAGRPVIPFRRPGGVTIIPVNAETGERVMPGDEKAIYEVFKPGQRPGGTLIDVPGSTAKSAPEEEIVIPGLF
ncbi:MAG TPA: penicillin-binding protein [Alphaproteobacteria bacterium]|nr:penicillin-binding protein 1A [Pseudomonadota bacterium]HAG24745.1 penicillin-binding protein [Alphaproteobacteria bacterium]